MLPSVGSRVTGSCATAQATAGVSAAAARRRPRLHAACGTCGTSEASCTNATTLQQLAADPSPKLQPWQQRWRRRVRCQAGDGPKPSSGGSGSGGKPPGGKPGGGQDALENIELLVGDCLCLLCFALYKQVPAARCPLPTARCPRCHPTLPHPASALRLPKHQITAIIFLPNFPGWLAPLHFNPTRLLEFVSFATTLVGTWVAAGMLTGGFRFAATADVPTALRWAGGAQMLGRRGGGRPRVPSLLACPHKRLPCAPNLCPCPCTHVAARAACGSSPCPWRRRS